MADDGSTGGLTIIGNLLPAVAEALHMLGGKVTKEKADAIAAEAAANHPYQDQTGQAASGFYVVTQDSSTYGQGFIGGSGKDGEEMLPEIEHPADDETAIVSNASAHFIYLELGTSRMPAFPSLVPALDSVAQSVTDGSDDWEQMITDQIGGGL